MLQIFLFLLFLLLLFFLGYRSFLKQQGRVDRVIPTWQDLRFLFRGQSSYVTLLPFETGTLRSTSRNEVATSWETAHQEGIYSDTFRLDENLSSQEERKGLSSHATEIHLIMEEENISFDEARLEHVRRTLRSQGIDPETGVSLDPRAVRFS